jgi:RNA polymerase sigma-70 factor, ECF subfamily
VIRSVVREVRVGGEASGSGKVLQRLRGLRIVATDRRIGVLSVPVGSRLKLQEERDDGLTAAFAAGDYSLAMELLLLQHADYIYGYCRRFLGNATEAEDVSQTVFAQAFEDLKSLSSPQVAHVWLRGIARHRCVDRLRARRRDFQVVEDSDLCAIVDREPILMSSDSDPRVAQALDDCLDCLDERSRVVLVLRFHDELTFEEISKLTHDSPGALRVRMGRALPALRRCLEAKGVLP